MTAMSNSEFAAHLLKLAQDAPAFQPMATYDPDGDCIEFLIKPDPFFAERIDDLVTVYYSQESREIIGSLIKDNPQAIESRTYRKLIQAAEESNVEAQLACV